MPLLRPLQRLRRRTAKLTRGEGYALAVLAVLVGMGLRYLAGRVGWPSPVGFVFLTYAIAAAATMDRGAGYLATLLAALASYPFLPRDEDGGVRDDWHLPFALFVVLGLWVSLLIESLTHALRELEVALAKSQEATRRRGLLLVEYRHRSRGDLQAVASLLRLRARHVTDPGGKAALAEAAGHTVALGRIHARLEQAHHDLDERATVDAGQFVVGVCADILPPVGDTWGASRWISTDRAVSLGLLLVELIAEARQDGARRIMVRLMVVEPDFLLDVIDDRPATGETDGMRGRLIDLLAKQLRGRVARAPNRAGPGLAASVRFPVLAPVLAPGHVGTQS